jgi:aminoglycoside 6-adenylyltransferase
MRGRFLEEWADRRAVTRFAVIFAHYDVSDAWRALLETMSLFRWLAKETAGALTCDYPDQSDEKTTTLVKKLYAEA